ncbi:MAG: YhdP family protein [Woeseiaceae bacterium]|nr:YhdP family protein [Woeseiaceae bacterium]
MQLDVADGTVIWRRSDTGITVLSDNIALQNPDFSSRSSLQISLPADGSSPVVDLEGRFSVSDINTATRYLPVNLIRPALYRWLTGALVAGRVTEGTVRFNGPLDRFPFDDNDGIFRIEAKLADSILRYSPQWPAAENLNLDLVIDRTRLYSDSNTATSAGNSVVDAEIEIADLREPVLTIDAFATGKMSSIRRFARESPIANVFGGHLERVTVEGDASFNLSLRYPILNRSAYDFTTRIQVSDATLRVDGFAPPVTEMNGIVRVTRNDVEAESLSGRILDAPVTIELARAGDALPSYNVVARLAGTLSAGGLATGFSLPIDGIAGGETPFSAILLFPRGGLADPEPFSLTVETDLNGMGLNLPAPLGKPADMARPLSLTVDFPAIGSVNAHGSYGDDIEWNLEFEKRDDGWDFDRGVLAAGGAEALVADTRGLHIVGETPELHVGEWLALATRNRSDTAAGGPTGIGDRVRSLDLLVDDLYVLGQHFGEHRVIVDRSANAWMARLSGAEAEGLLTIPYDLAGSAPLIVDMDRLVLPGSDDDSDGTAIATDPRDVPPILLRVRDFALGARRLGSVDTEIVRTPGGLAADEFRTASESFTIEGAARWEVESGEPAGQRTRVTAVLNSNDVAATMQALDSEPGIDGDDMEIRFDVSWSGGPREDFMDSLDGNVVVRFGPGQLNEVEPGAARMFGLMSVVALPRRLALDFRDVLDRGFRFDEINGTFQLNDGNAYTCDLSLKGPAADIGIVGRAGLVVKDYDQSAIVSPNVGNTLPVVGAVVAGPQVAAALLIFSQIFKKPLQEMGQVYYAIGGSWDEPVVESADARHFASRSDSVDCIEVAE